MHGTAGESCRVLNLLHSLRVGGKEKGVLQQLACARERGFHDRILVFDHAPGNSERDLDPGEIPIEFLPRGPGLDLGFPKRLREKVVADRVRILHARGDTALVYGALALRRLRHGRPRLVATYHGFPSYATWGARVLASWAARKADSVTVVSEELGRRLHAAGWLRRWTTIHNGVDPALYSPLGHRDGTRRLLGIGEGEFLVGHVGRFDANKSQEDLVAAIRVLSPDWPALHLAFVGTGVTQARVREIAGGMPQVHFIDRVADVPGFLRELDLFVLCSRHEGSPRSLLEAMATGLPVVATRVGGIPEIAGDSSDPCAILVPPGSPRALAEAIASTGDSLRRRRLGLLARQRILDAFTSDRAWSAYQDLYEMVLGPGRGPT